MSINQQIEKRTAVLLKRLEKVEKSIDAKIRIIATSQETSSAFWNNLQRELRKDYENARRIFADWAASNIPDQYNAVIAQQIKRMKGKTLPIKVPTFAEISNRAVNTQTINALLNEAGASYFIGAESGDKTLIRLMNLTQQVNVVEKQLNLAVERGWFDTGTFRGSAKRIQKELLTKALDGKYITVVDKNGVQRQYKIKYYSEMVARTKLQEASSAAVVNTALGVGADLIQVSSHNTTTPICIPFEGRIFSISGSDPNFPPAQDVPPFHPNGLHNITIVFRESLQRQGIMQKSIDFANGDTEIHPTRMSHIPISRRKVS